MKFDALSLSERMSEPHYEGTKSFVVLDLREERTRRRVSGVEQQVKKMLERTGVYNFNGTVLVIHYEN